MAISSKTRGAASAAPADNSALAAEVAQLRKDLAALTKKCAALEAQCAAGGGSDSGDSVSRREFRLWQKKVAKICGIRL
jgi:hypothetical protein